jgi:hypothetical protein
VKRRSSGASLLATANNWLERNRGWLLSVFLTACFASSWIASCAKPMWYDEFFTYHIASAHSIAHVWRILLEGFEPHPPLCYTLGHLSMSLIGVSSEAVRLPSMVAFCVLARPSMIVLAAAAVAFLAWQRLGERYRGRWAALLSCATDIAVLSHFCGLVAGLLARGLVRLPGDAGARKRMGVAARVRIAEQFSTRRVVDCYETLFAECVRSGN